MTVSSIFSSNCNGERELTRLTILGLAINPSLSVLNVVFKDLHGHVTLIFFF